MPDLLPDWYVQPGATIAHRLLANITPPRTLCGRTLWEHWTPAAASKRHCGQCLRREPARHAAAVPDAD